MKAANPADFARHEYGFWKFCIEKTKALPLKSVGDMADLKISIVAKSIQPGTVEPCVFALPNLPRVKNPEE